MVEPSETVERARRRAKGAYCKPSYSLLFFFLRAAGAIFFSFLIPTLEKRGRFLSLPRVPPAQRPIAAHDGKQQHTTAHIAYHYDIQPLLVALY